VDQVLLHQATKVNTSRANASEPLHAGQTASTSAGISESTLRMTILPGSRQSSKALRVRRVLAKEPRAEAVECRDPGFAVVVVQAQIDAPCDLRAAPLEKVRTSILTPVATLPARPARRVSTRRVSSRCPVQRARGAAVMS